MWIFKSIAFHAWAVLSLFSHHNSYVPPVPLASVSISPMPTVSQRLLKATGTITQSGKSVTINALFPQNGGVVTGSISGDCHGILSGTYSGENAGKNLQGVAHADCPVLFFTIHASATYTGEVNDSDTLATFHYIAQAGNFSRKGDIQLTLIVQ